MTFISQLKIATVSLSSLLCAAMVSCGDTMTYADHQDKEDEDIENFIKTHKVEVVNIMPQDSGEWVNESHNDIYFHYTSGKAKDLYYHQVELGDGEMVPQNNWTAYVRYVGYTLSGNMVYNCTAQYSPDPQSFKIKADAEGETFGPGFQQAIKNLRVGGKCKVVIPFKIGNEANITISGTSVSDVEEFRPMYYEIELVALE